MKSNGKLRKGHLQQIKDLLAQPRRLPEAR